MRKILHFVDGSFVEGEGARRGDVFDPTTGEPQAQVNFASPSDVDAAVASAIRAQREWAQVNSQERARKMVKFVDLLNSNLDEIASLLSSEHGKTLEDAKGDVIRGREVAEFVTAAPHMLKGEYSDSAGRGIDVYSMRQPVGVGVAITPFNFPAMIPLWMLAPALMAGNAMILKPSEQDPSVPNRIAELLIAAGFPPGLLNVIHGDKEAVDALITHPGVNAVSFVGSTPVARHVYATSSANGKRVQCFGGAKNHMIIMPDADMKQAANALVGAGYGAAGERCMAISVAVPVGAGTAERLHEHLVPMTESLVVGRWDNPKADYGPLVNARALARVRSLVDEGVADGAQLKVDGRDFSLAGHENGYFLGPCLFDNVKPDMSIYREEIFGPVLSIVRAANYEEALQLVNDSPYGNGTSIFTASGQFARDFASRVTVGMVGVNIPIPVPLAYYTFGGWKSSVFGDLNQHGPDAFRFWTRIKTVTSRWTLPRAGAEMSMPVVD